MTALQVPETYQRDIERAVAILKDAGCSHVYLFGSLGLGRPRPTSDIDLAIRGCLKGRFFYLLGKLMLELDHPVDLVRLDAADPFARRLEKEGELVRVG
jgi:predicted nucleotidyltransferase